MLLPALKKVDLEVTGEVVVIMGGNLTVAGTAACSPRLTASCPAMESSVRRNILWSSNTRILNPGTQTCTVKCFPFGWVTCDPVPCQVKYFYGLTQPPHSHLVLTLRLLCIPFLLYVGGKPLGLHWYDYNSNNHYINHNYINHHHDYHDHNNHNHNNHDNYNNNHHLNKMRNRLVGGWEQVFLLCIRPSKLFDCTHLMYWAWRNPCHH